MSLSYQGLLSPDTIPTTSRGVVCFAFETECCCVAQASPELLIFLPRPPKAGLKHYVHLSLSFSAYLTPSPKQHKSQRTDTVLVLLSTGAPVLAWRRAYTGCLVNICGMKERWGQGQALTTPVTHQEPLPYRQAPPASHRDWNRTLGLSGPFLLMPTFCQGPCKVLTSLPRLG